MKNDIALPLCNYHASLELARAGYNIPAKHYYEGNSEVKKCPHQLVVKNTNTADVVIAPEIDLAIEWLRKNFLINLYTYNVPCDGIMYNGWKVIAHDGKEGKILTSGHPTREHALNNAIYLYLKPINNKTNNDSRRIF